MLRVDDGQMAQAASDICLVAGCSLDSILRYIGPSAAVVRTTSQSQDGSRPTVVHVQTTRLYLVYRPPFRRWHPPQPHTVGCSANTYAQYASIA